MTYTDKWTNQQGETNKASIDDRLCKSENDGQSFSQSSMEWQFLVSRYGQLAVSYLEKALTLFAVTREADKISRTLNVKVYCSEEFCFFP